MGSFILILAVPEVSGQEAEMHPGQANKRHHGYELESVILFKDALVLKASPPLLLVQANSSALFKRDSSFCHTLKSHFMGGKRVSSDQPG